MTLVCVEGFDHMSTTDLMFSKNWTWETVVGLWTPSFGTGRINGKAFVMQEPVSEQVYGRFTKTLPSTYSSFVSGFAFKVNHMPLLGLGSPIFAFTTSGAVNIVTVYVNSDGSVSLVGSSFNTLATSGIGLFTANAWHQFEVKIHVNGASGSVGVHLDGVEVIAPTTVNIGSTSVQYIGPYSISNSTWPSGVIGVFLDYDDVWLADTAGGVVADFIGDAHVETLFPNADGTHSDWSPNSGIIHFNRVNEHSGTYPDDDTSYVSSLTAGDEDSWAYDNLSIVSGTVFGLQTNLYARKEDSNLRQLKALTVSGGNTYEGSVVQTLASGYVDSTEISETDPFTTAQWDIAGVNAAEFGVKVET